MKQFFTNLLTQAKLTILRIFSYPYTITIAIITLFTLFFFYVTELKGSGFGKAAGRMIRQIEASDRVRDSFILRYETHNNCTKALANQYKYISDYKKQHIGVAGSFETYYYAFVLILALAGVTSSILGVLIARTGWQNQPPTIRAAFIGFFFTASFTGVCINVFNNSANADKNISKYFYFTNLQTNIYNSFANPDSFDARCKDSALIRVYNSNNENIKSNMNLFLDINADKIPATDFQKTVGN